MQAAAHLAAQQGGQKEEQAVKGKGRQQHQELHRPAVVRGLKIFGQRAIQFHQQHGSVEKGAARGQDQTARFVENETGRDDGQDEERGEVREAAARGVDEKGHEQGIGPELGEDKGLELPALEVRLLQQEGRADGKKAERQQEEARLRQGWNNEIVAPVTQQGRCDAEDAHQQEPEQHPPEQMFSGGRFAVRHGAEELGEKGFHGVFSGEMCGLQSMPSFFVL